MNVGGIRMVKNAKGIARHGAERRRFMKSALALSGATAAASITGQSLVWGASAPIKHKSLDPVNPDILFGTASGIWGGGGFATNWWTAPGNSLDAEFWIKRVAQLGLQGIEFYGDGIEARRSNP